MAKVRLNGDSSGFIELAAPNAAGSNTLTLPTSNGSANQLLKNSGTAGALAWSTLTEDSSGNLNVDSGTLFVDATNNRVGVGTTSPTDPNGFGTCIDVRSSTGAAIYLRDSDDTVNDVFIIGRDNSDSYLTSNSGNLLFLNNGSERARIDSSGRFLVGTSTARTGYAGNTPEVQIEAAKASDSVRFGLCNNSNGVQDSQILLAKTRGTSVGSNTVVQDGDTLGRIAFLGADGTDLEVAAQISSQVDGTPGNNDMPGRLVFSTTADGASSPTERMRIDNLGRSMMNQTSVTDFAALSISFNSGAASTAPATGLAINQTNASTGTIVGFRNSSGTVIGSISNNNNGTITYNNSSDYRLKENIVDLDGAIDRLQAIPVRRFNFIGFPDKTVDGFVAHEIQDVVPEAVTGAKDAVDADGNPIYQGIDQSKLVPLLTAALQEAIGRIETLEAEVENLKAS